MTKKVLYLKLIVLFRHYQNYVRCGFEDFCFLRRERCILLLLPYVYLNSKLIMNILFFYGR